ncbi:MAG: hypothetical protein AAGJ28_22595, partial [Pseudomonadota bacterium]
MRASTALYHFSALIFTAGLAVSLGTSLAAAGETEIRSDGFRWEVQRAPTEKSAATPKLPALPETPAIARPGGLSGTSTFSQTFLSTLGAG